jgi:site-specific recombinase XerD
MTDQLPVLVSRGKNAITTKRTTPQIVMPALIADLGEDAS